MKAWKNTNGVAFLILIVGILLFGSGIEAYSIDATKAANIINGGIVTEDENWIYFSNVTGEKQKYNWSLHQNAYQQLNYTEFYKGLFKRRKGTDAKIYKINSDNASNLNYADGWLYYTAASTDESDHLYCVNTDGTDEKDVTSARIQQYEINNDRLYYTDFFEPGELNICRLDGTEKSNTHISLAGIGMNYELGFLGSKMIYHSPNKMGSSALDGSAQAMYQLKAQQILGTDSSFIYYQDDNYAIKRCGVDGSNDQLLMGGMLSSLSLDDVVLDNGTIYYLNKGRLFSIACDGTNPRDLGLEVSSLVTVRKGWIYFKPGSGFTYTDQSSGNNKVTSTIQTVSSDTFRCRLDGSDSQKLLGLDPTYVIPSRKFPGLIKFDDEWIYFITNNSFNELRNLCRIRYDGSGFAVLGTQKVRDFDVAGDWLYFSNCDDGNRLYRMKVDGSQCMRISQNEAVDIKIKSDRVFFKNSSGDNRLYRISTDGTKKQELRRGSIRNLMVQGNWIYFIDDNDRYRIHRMEIGSWKDVQLTEDSAFSMHVTDDSIYYVKAAVNGSFMENMNVACMKLDGTGKRNASKAIVPRKATTNGQWIYFLNPIDSSVDKAYPLYRMKADGSELTCVSAKNILNYTIVNDWIYFTTLEPGYAVSKYQRENKNMFRLRIDASIPEKLDNVLAEYISSASGKVYYLQEDDSGNLLIEMDPDNPSQRRSIATNVIRFQTYENNIYFSDVWNRLNNYEFATQRARVLTKMKFFNFWFDNGSVCYQDDNYDLVVMSLDNLQVKNRIQAKRYIRELVVTADQYCFSMFPENTEYIVGNSVTQQCYVCNKSSSTPKLLSDKLFNDELACLGNNLYLTVANGGNRAYDRIDLTSLQSTSILKRESFRTVLVDNDRLMLASPSGIFTSNLDLSDMHMITNDKPSDCRFVPYGNHVFYCSGEDYEEKYLYCKTFGQTKAVKVTDISADKPAFLNGRLYVVNKVISSMSIALGKEHNSDETLYIDVLDKGGTDETPLLSKVKQIVDAVPPVIVIGNYDKSSTYKSITVVASTNEGTLNETSHTFTQNGEFVFEATDEAGNKSTSKVVITNIDNNPPQIKATGKNNKILNDGESYAGVITLTITDESSIIKELLLDGKGIAWPISDKLSKNGNYVVSVVDSAGNQSTMKLTIKK